MREYSESNLASIKVSPASAQMNKRQRLHQSVESIYKEIYILKLARFIGAFPLKFVDNDPECLQYDPKTKITLVAVAVVTFAIYLAEVFVLRMNGLYGWTLSDEMKQQGLKTTDTLAMGLLWLPNICAIFVYYFGFMPLGPSLSGLSRKIAEVPHIALHDDELQKYNKWGQIKRFFCTIIGVAACILSGVIDGLIVSPLIHSIPWIFFVAFLKILIAMIILISPTSAAASMIMGRTLEMLRLMFKQYTDKMQSLAEDRRNESNISWRRQFIETGFYINDLIHMTERSLGQIIFISFAVSFVTEILAGFFGIMLFTAFSDSGFNVLEFHFGLFFALFGFWHFLRFYSLASKCQSISNLAKKARRMTEQIIVKEEVTFSDSEMVKLRILMKRWSKPAALRPLDAFDVGRAMGFSVYGLLVTYIIVLLQFKVGEGSQ